jgi:hypothetical protein
LGSLLSCGGGSPDVSSPHISPVDSISEADLISAGVPLLPADEGSSAASSKQLKSTSAFSIDVGKGMMHEGFELIGESGNDYLRLSPEDIPSRRIIGWSLYRLTSPSEDNFPLAFQLETDGSGEYPLFYAIGNYSSGRWELGGRIVIDVISAGFSLGSDYLSPGGNAYLMVAAGHPGSNNLPTAPLVVKPPQVKWTGAEISRDDWSASMFRADGELVTFTLGLDDGNSSELSFEVDYDISPGPGGFQLAFPVESKLSGFQYRESDFNFLPLWEGHVPPFFSGMGLPQQEPLSDDIPLVAFFNSNDVNGMDHPFSFRSLVYGDSNLDGRYLNIIATELDAGAKDIEISGILLGDTTGNDRIAAPDVPIKIRNMQGQLLQEFNTDSKGRFTIKLSKDGESIWQMPGSFIWQMPGSFSWQMPSGDAMMYNKITIKLVDDGLGQTAYLSFTALDPEGLVLREDEILH